MGYSDNPFSITSKFNVPGGAEHLVTIRGANASDFKAHLHEADVIFPEAKFLSWTMVPEATLPDLEDVPEPALAPPNVEAQREETVTRLKAKAHAQAAEAVAQEAMSSFQKKGGEAKTNGNSNGDGQSTPLCPAHGRSAKSKFDGGLYCPTALNDGSYCKWHWHPGSVPAGVN